jgi:hypothetical protein
MMSPDLEPVEEDLVQMFNRLAIQAKSYDMAFHFPEPYVIRLTSPREEVPFVRNPFSPLLAEGGLGAGGVYGNGVAAPAMRPPPSLPPKTDIPEVFTTLREARFVWDRLCERMLRFTEILMDHNTPSDRPRGMVPDAIKHVGVGFRTQLHEWSCAYHPLFAARFAPTVSGQEKAGLAVLKMFHLMGHILFMMTFSDSEMPFDGFREEFAMIVNLALEIAGGEEVRGIGGCFEASSGQLGCRHYTAAAQAPIFMMLFHGGNSALCNPGGAYHVVPAVHVKPSFCADLGIVPPLFVVGTKCRDPYIRRQAIRLLLNCHRREGMWDSKMTGTLCNWVMHVEEGWEDDYEREVSELGVESIVVEEVPIVSGTAPYSYPGADGLLPGRSEVETLLSPDGSNAGVFVPKRRERRRDSGIDLPSSFGKYNMAYRHKAMHNPEKQYLEGPIPEHRRVMVKSVHFDLQGHTATALVGTRAQKNVMCDSRRRQQELDW